MMYAYAIIERHEEKFDKYIFVVDSEKNPLTSYVVFVTVSNSKIKVSCNCKGFAIKGRCKHSILALRKLKLYRSISTPNGNVTSFNS